MTLPALVAVVAACERGPARMTPARNLSVSERDAESRPAGRVVTEDSGIPPFVAAPLLIDSGASSPNAGPNPPSEACTWASARSPRFESFRAQVASFTPGSTCCALRGGRALCRVYQEHHHFLGPYVAIYLVGLTAGDRTPWLNAPLLVSSHGSMKYSDLTLLRLVLAATTTEVTLNVGYGTCPRPCATSAVGCKGTELDIDTACSAVGAYRMTEHGVEHARP